MWMQEYKILNIPILYAASTNNVPQKVETN